MIRKWLVINTGEKVGRLAQVNASIKLSTFKLFHTSMVSAR